MQASFDQFKTNYQHINELDFLFLFLKDNLKLSNDLSDLLRAEIVYSVSALDTLIHNLIRVGMLQTFNGTRVRTSKFKCFPISSETLLNIQSSALNNLISPTIPFPQYWFEQDIVQKHKILAFQDPDKIADGLSLIWGENHKWAVLSSLMFLSEEDTRMTLRNIVLRRNQIVHESDFDIQAGLKNKIEYSDVKITTTFIEKLGKCIFDCVK